MKLKGPELKKPELKVPPFLVDLYWDLRDRHLLPLVGLIVVAIVAVPFLLGGDSEDPSSEVQEIVAEAATAEASGATAQLSVVEAKPGLRDYRRRLRDRTPTDPFEQRLTAPQVGEADLPESEAESSSGGETKETTTTTVEAKTKEGSVTVTETETSEGENAGSEGDSSAPADAGGDLRFRSITIDVRIVRTTGSAADGTKEKSEPTVKRDVLASTPLPGPKAQVVTFMGLSPKTFKPTFLVSTEVTAMFGEAQCASGTEVCQLVELEQGIPQTFVFGGAGDRYKVEVTEIDLTTVRPPR